MMHEVLLRVHMARQLPQTFWEKQAALPASQKRYLRAQATLRGEVRETAPSSWGRGLRSREAVWLSGSDALAWRLSERDLRDVKAHGARIKVHIYAAHPMSPRTETSEAIGWFMVDLRDLAAAPMTERLLRLQGAGTAEVKVSASLSVVAETERRDGGAASSDVFQPAEPPPPSPSGGVTSALPSAPDAADLDALPIGPGASLPDSSTFLLTVALKGASDLVALAPQLDGACDRFWLSYAAFGMVVQTGQFPRLRRSPSEAAGCVSGDGAATTAAATLPPYFEPISDTFRLRATLPDLVAFLCDLQPLQVYLCAENRIVAHASVDLGLLLRPDEWGGRPAAEFSAAGIEGAFELRLPGAAAGVAASAAAARGRGGGGAAAAGVPAESKPVVEIAVGLVREDAAPPAAARGGEAEGEGAAWVQPPAAAGAAVDKAAPAVKIWAHEAPPPPPPPVFHIMAALEGLRLTPAAGDSTDDGGGDTEEHKGSQTPTERRRALLTVALVRAARPEPVDGGAEQECSNPEGRAVLLCGERGELNADAEELAAVPECHWQAKGDAAAAASGAGAGRGAGEGLGTFARVVVADAGSGAAIATANVPWPNPALHESEASLELVDAVMGGAVGSCHVTFLREALASGGGEGSRAASAADACLGGGGISAGGAAGAVGSSVSAAAVPHLYRLCINLASVRDMDAAAYLTVGYKYLHLGGGAPVRTALAWAPPRAETPLGNGVCTYEFGATPAQLQATLEDHPLVVSVFAREKHADREVGLAALPLPELAAAAPRYFRCRESGKTFTSAAAYRAHWRGLRRAAAAAGGSKRDRGGRPLAALAAPSPVEVRVVDRYVTVALADAAAFEREATSSGGKRPLPQRLCSMRVILMLEDMGLVPATESTSPLSAAKAPVEAGGAEMDDAAAASWGASGDGAESGVLPHVAWHEGVSAGAEAAVLPEAVRSLMVAEAMRQWEDWRQRQEASWAEGLRAKDEALVQRWEQREAERHKAMQRAQSDYAKLEARLRKALAEVEVRERTLQSREEALKTDHAARLAELQLLQRRLREESRHQVELEKMRAAALEKQLATHKAALSSAETRLRSCEDEFDRYRQAQRRTPEAALRLELAQATAAAAAATAETEKERSEKHKALLEREECRAHVHRLAAALKRQQRKEASAARRQLEQMRLEYLAREQRFALDGDRGELRTIKRELDELRHVGLVQEAATALGRTTAAATVTAATATAPQHGPAAGTDVDSGGVTESADAAEWPEAARPAAAGWGATSSMPSQAPAPAATPRAPLQQRPSSLGEENVRPCVQPWKTESVSSMAGMFSLGKPQCGWERKQPPAEAAAAAAPRGGTATKGFWSGDNSDAAGVVNAVELARLVEWRKDLVATGIYGDSHPIISELDRRLSAAATTWPLY